MQAERPAETDEDAYLGRGWVPPVYFTEVTTRALIGPSGATVLLSVSA
jgi:hypothetical protein